MADQSPLIYHADNLLGDFSWKVAFTCGVSCLSWIVGGLDQLVVSLYILMAADFFLGFSRAWKTERISGSKLKHGIMKFLLYSVTVWIALQIQQGLHEVEPNAFGFRFSLAVRDWLVAYRVLNEGLSCLSHLAYFRVPIPQRLIRRLRNYRDCIFQENPHSKEEDPADVGHRGKIIMK